MNGVAVLGKKERAELFLLTAQRMNLHPVNIEKDFWVCWLLKQLFTMPELDGWLVFKGGLYPATRGPGIGYACGAHPP